MRFIETVLDTYTYGVKGGSYRLNPPPPPSTPLSLHTQFPTLHNVQAVRNPCSPPPATVASPRSPHAPSIKLKLASLNRGYLLTTPTARRLFESNSPDVSLLVMFVCSFLDFNSYRYLLLVFAGYAGFCNYK